MSKRKKQTPKPAGAPAAKALPAKWAMPAWVGRTRLCAGLLFAFSFLLYANTLQHDYALDDAIVLTENMFTQQGVEGIPGLLKYDTFYGFFKEAGKANLVAGGRYRPLTPIMFAVERSLFGDSPAVGHLFNAVYYGATVVVLYFLLLWLFTGPRGRKDGLGELMALLAALIFAAHPLHTEVVANIKGRDEIITLLCALGAMHLSLLGAARRSVPLALAAGAVFFLGLMAKENAIMLLVLLPLTYHYFTKERPVAVALHTLPFGVAAAAFLAIRFSVLGFAMGKVSMELMNNPFLKLVGGQYVPFSAGEKLATVLYTLGLYLKLLVVPHPLTHDYYPRHIDMMTFGDGPVLLALALHLGLLAVAIRGLRQRTVLSYGIWFYLISLSLVSNLVFAVGTNMAERLLFMPGVGFSIAVAALMGLAVAQRRASVGNVLAIGGALALALGLATVLRNPAWKDNYTLFTTDVKTSPNSAKLRNAVGGELVTRAATETNEAKREAMCREALTHLREAARIHPTYKNAYLLQGNAHNYLREYEASIAAYLRALAIDPDYLDATNNLAITYREAGKYAGEAQGNLPQAIDYLEKALQLDPEEYEATRLLGVAYGIGGNPDMAIEYFTRCTEMRPDNAFAWYDLGSAYGQAGDVAAAETFIAKAREIDPEIDAKRMQPQ